MASAPTLKLDCVLIRRKRTQTYSRRKAPANGKFPGHVHKTKVKAVRKTSSRDVAFGVELSDQHIKKSVSANSTLTSAISTRWQQVIDLTDDTEHCAVCTNILSKEENDSARIFVLERCCCIVCGECILSSGLEVKSESGIMVKQFNCPRWDHSDQGVQNALEIFGIDCSICWRGADNAVRRTLTPCGHSFCHGCIEKWNDSEYGGRCPCCRKSFDKGLSTFRNFETVQRGVLRRICL